MVNPDLDGLEGKWDKDSTLSKDDQLKIPTDSRLYAVQVICNSCLSIFVLFVAYAFRLFDGFVRPKRLNGGPGCAEGRANRRPCPQPVILSICIPPRFMKLRHLHSTETYLYIVTRIPPHFDRPLKTPEMEFRLRWRTA